MLKLAVNALLTKIGGPLLATQQGVSSLSLCPVREEGCTHSACSGAPELLHLSSVLQHALSK